MSFNTDTEIWQEQLTTPRYESNLNKVVGMVNEYTANKGVVLELGCGISKHIERINREEIYAIDTSQEMLNKNRKNAYFFKHDALNLPREWDNKFDCVFCNGLIHHIENHQKLLDNVKRVLKRGGIFVFIEPASISLSGIYYYIKHFFLMILSKEKVKNAVGFIDEDEKYVNYFNFRKLMASNDFSKIEYGTRQLIRLPPLRILRNVNVEWINDNLNINPFGTTLYGAWIYTK